MMRINKAVWPSTKTCAAMVSVNLDAEFFGRFFYPDVNVDEGDIYRLGQSGMRYGLPRLLDTLDHYGVKATFFVPGAVAQRYSKEVEEVAARGHEIGCRGYAHEIMAQMPIQKQRQMLEKSCDILREVTKQTPVGFRLPNGEMTEETLALVKEMGFLYSSSLSDDDEPYVRQPMGLLELPVHWALYDVPYFAFAFDPPIPPGQARSAEMAQVLQNWQYELEGTRRYGALMVLQLDPLAIGEQGRIFILERLLEKMQEDPTLWLATGKEIAEHFLIREKYV